MIGAILEISRTGTEKLSFDWQIQDIYNIQRGKSPEIMFGYEYWWLQIHLSGDLQDSSGWLRLSLCRRNNKGTFKVSVGIGVRMEKKREGESRDKSNVIMFSSEDLVWNDFCSLPELKRRESSLIPGGVLTIRCVLSKDMPGAARANYLKCKMNALNKERKTYKVQIPKLEEQITKIESDITSYKSLINNLEIKLSSNEEDYVEQLQAKSSIVCELEKENCYLKAQIDRLQVENQTLLREKTTLDEVKSYLGTEFQKLKESATFLNQDIVQKEDKISGLEREICDLKAQIVQLQEENQRLMGEKAKLDEYLEADFKLKESSAVRIQEDNGFESVNFKDMDSSLGSLCSSFQDIVKVPHDASALMCDFSDLYTDEVCPNFVLKCQGWSIPVNTFVLSVRSEFFREMFWKITQEEETRSIDIKDLELPVLMLMLKFLYCGRLEGVSEGTVVDLYGTGDKYAHSLQEACRDWMARNTNRDNFVTFLKVSESHSDQDLKAAVVSFIFQNPGVMKTPDWLTFSKQHRDLANEVLQAYLSSIIP